MGRRTLAANLQHSAAFHYTSSIFQLSTQTEETQPENTVLISLIENKHASISKKFKILFRSI